MKVEQLKGPELDWFAAAALKVRSGFTEWVEFRGGVARLRTYRNIWKEMIVEVGGANDEMGWRFWNPTEDDRYAGPIIDYFKINTLLWEANGSEESWQAGINPSIGDGPDLYLEHSCWGPTRKIAAMRAVVHLHHGPEVDTTIFDHLPMIL